MNKKVIIIILFFLVLVAGCALVRQRRQWRQVNLNQPSLKVNVSDSNNSNQLAVSNNNQVGGNSQSVVQPAEKNFWIYPSADSSQLLWGIKDGIVFALDGADFNYHPGGLWAKGLLRVGFSDAQGKTYFFNYLGLGLLGSKGKYDASEIKRIKFYPDNFSFTQKLSGLSGQALTDAVSLEKNPPVGLAQATTVTESKLSVIFRLSPFLNTKAQIYLVVEIDKNRPREIKISSFNPLAEQIPLSYISLSATYGNLGRLRDLYLADKTVKAGDLFQDQTAGKSCFYGYQQFGVNQLIKNSDGSVVVYAGNDETGDWAGDLGGNAPYYGLPKFYQYWKKYAGSYQPDLVARVNGRDNYFGGFINGCSQRLVTGGVAYENFEMLEKFYPGQTFWFGYSYEK